MLSGAARVLAWLFAALMILALPQRARAAPGFTEQCEAALPKEQVDELVEAMRAVEGGCTLGRVDTTTFRTLIEWRAGERELEILLGPKACVLEPTHVGSDLAFHAPTALASECPEVLAALQGFVGQPHEVAQISPTHALAWSSEPERTTFADPLIAAGLAWIAATLLALILLWQRRKATRDEDDRGWTRLALAGFGVGLLARFAVEPSLGNWYGAFLPAEGWGELRFGTSAAIVQACVRAILPWTTTTAFGLFRVIGALAVPLTIVLVRRLGSSLAAAALAAIVIGLAPIPVRLSASSSEHLLAATLALAAWVTWLRTASDPSGLVRVLAIVLAWLAVMTRVDCLPQLALIPLWTVLVAREGWLPLARRLVDAAWFALCLAAILVHAWLEIVVPSNHPGPELVGIRWTIELLFTQFWIAASEPPHWITPTCLALVVLGVIAAAVLRRWGLLAAAFASVVLIFVPLGRNLSHDGLTGARYFVLLMPLLALLAGTNVALIERRWPATRRSLAIAGLLAIAALETFAAQPGWRQQYTFQAEYTFLARALREHAGELEGCTLWYVRPRQTTGEADLDCCLWPSDSPLQLDAPELRFRPMPLDRDPDDAQGCQLYYEGSVCALDPAKIDLSPLAVERIADQCERLREHAGPRELAGESVTETTLSPRFHGRPWLRLTARDAP
ncbi:hypothetical protein ACNOYE_11660 [Nannocystaceae bacterium ST9]